ncbi:LppP/LprE family lipoprotein [Alicyclobacillus mengziensis]|uniref:LppP/LprE family lipoprotein n=1 Tax=Alicyclobacillus mengziensis TaxID=2931921 RepID=A0A9X7VYM9_9BACL|nr:LppP/LprE family lipoprotein [Alicyclobacillus mengziensis]QSO47469.1 LppP/LprE family lipoprotein [Alicyclobacillus mengziensis]
MKYKAGLIGIMATSAIAAQMLMPVVAHASTSVKYASTAIEVTGQATLNPQHVVANDPWSGKSTSWVPVYYLQAALKSFGVHTTWNGNTLNVTSTPSGWNVNVSGAPQTGTPPTGEMQFSINGNQDDFIRAPKLIANDPASKAPTTYVPIYYANRFLKQRLQMNATWTGNAWSMTSQLNKYANEIALINAKGYDVPGTPYDVTRSAPNASVQTASGETLSAWIGVKMGSDGYNQFVFFFLNGKYLGTDTAKPSLEITSAKAAGNGIAVTYPVYRKNDSFADPTGTPVTITYAWNGSELVPNKSYPKQFQSSTISSSSTANAQVTKRSYASPSEAANAVINVEDGLGQMHSSNPPLNLGFGIKAHQNGSLGTYTINWTEGNWTIIVTGPSSSPETQVAQQVVTYLHTHMLPTPQNNGAIFIHQPGSSSNAAADWQSTIAWQEGTKVNELQQTGNPVEALQTVVNYK